MTAKSRLRASPRGCDGTEQYGTTEFIIGHGEKGLNRMEPEVCREVEDRGDGRTQRREAFLTRDNLRPLGRGERHGLPARQLLRVEPEIGLLLGIGRDHPIHRVIIEDVRSVFGLPKMSKLFGGTLGHTRDGPCNHG